MRNCKQCTKIITEENDGAPWGNPNLCQTCADEKALAKGCNHIAEYCDCAADPTPNLEELTDFLRRNLRVVVEVEETDTDGGYYANDKRYITVSLTMHGEVIARDSATIDLNQ
jgi:hypothetical protein